MIGKFFLPLVQSAALPPYPIVRAPHFFEFLRGLADISFDGDKVHLPPVLFQPMAADDVASGVGRIAVGPPVNGIVEIGGPEQFRLNELVRRRLATLKDPREVIADPHARYAGAEVSERTLLPGKDARLIEKGSDFNSFLKWDQLGKGNQSTSLLSNLLAQYKIAMKGGIGGSPNIAT